MKKLKVKIKGLQARVKLRRAKRRGVLPKDTLKLMQAVKRAGLSD